MCKINEDQEKNLFDGQLDKIFPVRWTPEIPSVLSSRGATSEGKLERVLGKYRLSPPWGGGRSVNWG